MTDVKRQIVLHLPAKSIERLEQWADEAGKTTESLTEEIVEQAVQQHRPEAASGSPRTTREILEAVGLIRPLSPYLRQLIIPGVTLEQVRAAMSRAAGPSLSEIILEQRGPKS